jgi:hypothetical protein
VPFPSQTNATLNIANAQLADAGSYDVFISDVYGSVKSTAATLTVIPADSDGDGIPDAWELTCFPGNLAAMNQTTAAECGKSSAVLLSARSAKKGADLCEPRGLWLDVEAVVTDAF